eukprot:1207199-Amphidinium_carterae.1
MASTLRSGGMGSSRVSKVVFDTVLCNLSLHCCTFPSSSWPPPTAMHPRSIGLTRHTPPPRTLA